MRREAGCTLAGELLVDCVSRLENTRWRANLAQKKGQDQILALALAIFSTNVLPARQRKVTTVKRTWHISDSQDQILALALR